MTNLHTASRRMSDRVFDIVNYSFLVLFTILTVFPFYNSVILSFNDGDDAAKGGIYFFPRLFTLANYAKVFANPDFVNAAFITVSRTVVGTVTALFFTAAFGYIISKEYLIFRKIYVIAGIVTLYFSGGLIPTFILIRDLGLINNFLVYILPGLLSMMNALIFMSFFRTIPASLEESARLDGAGDIRIFTRIILPVSTPVLASIALFIAVGQWNSWYDTMLYTNIPSLDTLSNLFQKMVTTQAYLDTSNISALTNRDSLNSTSISLSAMVVTTTPIIAVYPFLQKYFAAGIMLGSVKG